MKRIILLVLVIALFFTSCSNNKKEETTYKNDPTTKVSQTEKNITKEDKIPNKLDVETENELKNTAILLTKAIANSTKGFSADVKNPASKLTPPNENDQNSIANFIVLIMGLSNPESNPQANNTLYKNRVYMDKDNYFHIKKSFIPIILKDVLDITNYKECLNILEDQLSFKADKESAEYINPLSFGSGYDWCCKEIKNIKIDTDKKIISVDYSVGNLYEFAGGAKEEITEYKCQNIYAYGLKDSNEYYLSLKTIEIIDYIKTNNPDSIY